MEISARIIAVAMVSFARISREVFAKLNAEKKAGISYRLAPLEWASEKIVRVIDMIGSSEKIKEPVENLHKAQAKGGIAIQC